MFFRTIKVRVLVDDQESWFANMTSMEPLPLTAAPELTATTLRNLANRLDDLAKAEALGLPADVAMQFAGLRRDPKAGPKLDEHSSSSDPPSST